SSQPAALRAQDAPPAELLPAPAATAEQIAALPPLPWIEHDRMWIGPDEYRDRRDRLAKLLEPDGGMMLMRAYRDHNVDAEIGPERQDNDSLYLTGCNLLGDTNPGAYLIITPTRQALVLPDLPTATARATMMRDAIERGGFRATEVFAIGALDAVLRDTLKSAQQVFMQHAVSEEGEFATRGRQRGLRFADLSDKVRKLLASIGNDTAKIPDVPGTSCTFRVMALRAIKNAAEIERLKEAATITATALRETVRFSRPGMYEGDMCQMLRIGYREHGAPHMAFGPIVGSGPNSLVLHYQPKPGEQARQMNAGDIVVVDNGAEYLGYAADYTRTICIDGPFTEAQREQAQAVLDSHLAALEIAKPGVTIVELHRRSVASLAEHYPGEDTRRNYPHLVGHHVGMHVHDPVDFRAPLRPGHCFTIEPGWYVKATGIGVRIEDSYVVNADGTIERITRTDLVPFEPEPLGKLVGAGYRDWHSRFGMELEFVRQPDPDVPTTERMGLRIASMPRERPLVDWRVGDVVLAVNDIPVLGTEYMLAAESVIRSATVVRDGKLVRVLPVDAQPASSVPARETALRARLEALADHPLQNRPAGSVGAAVVFGYVSKQLSAMGLRPQVERRPHDDDNGVRRISAELSVDLPAAGSASGSAIELIVPYDTPRTAVVGWGCPDNAALAVALEFVRELISTPVHNSLRVRFVSFADATTVVSPAEPDDDDDATRLRIQLWQLCPGRRLDHRVRVVGSGEWLDALSRTIRSRVRGGRLRFTPAPAGMLTWSAGSAPLIDLSLPAPPGQAVRPFNLDRDDLVSLSRMVTVLRALVVQAR
ncbi:MAG: M24 family metallopeptidase, partial [Planctomycetota bacterium]